MHVDQTERASLQSDLRTMTAMLCGLSYDADDRLVLLDGPAV